MAFHEGPPMRRRWPVGFIALGFGLLSWFTFSLPQAQNFLEQTIWWMSAAGISGISLAFLLFGTKDLRKLSAATILAYSALRAVGSIHNDTFTPIGVWLIVGGLTVSAYKSQVRQESQTAAP